MRFERMRGHDVLWQPGTDHAGIATQMVVERQLMERQEPDRRAIGREAFLAACGNGRPRAAAPSSISSSGWALLRLVARALHHGRGPLAGGAQGLRRSLPRRADLQGQAPRQLGSRSCRPRSPTSRSSRSRSRASLWHCAIRSKALHGLRSRRQATYIVVATTRPETMLGDTAVAVHPEDERYKDSVGKNAILPLVGRGIPIVADEYSIPRRARARSRSRRRTTSTISRSASATACRWSTSSTPRRAQLDGNRDSPRVAPIAGSID